MAPNDTPDLDVDTFAATAPLDVQMEVEVLAVDAIPLPSEEAHDDEGHKVAGEDGDHDGATLSGAASADAPTDEHTAADEASAEQADPEAQERATDVDTSEDNALVATTTEQPQPSMGKITGGWGYVYAAYGVTWTCLALYVAYLVIYRRMQSTGGNS